VGLADSSFFGSRHLLSRPQRCKNETSTYRICSAVGNIRNARDICHTDGVVQLLEQQPVQVHNRNTGPLVFQVTVGNTLGWQNIYAMLK
jgi:hypothetical protein